MKKIQSCRICSSKLLTPFLDLGDQPYANSLLKNPNEKENFYPLSLSFCNNCSLVQLNHTADPRKLFSNYVWVTATSNTARQHAETFFKETIRQLQGQKKGYILEIASNDGTFLKPFIQNGYKVLGIDPAKNIVDMAISNGIPTICDFFGINSAKKIIKENGLAEIVIARNVLPHIANLHDFVKGMSIALDKDGLLAMEVHYAKKIYDELHYDSIYHEHLCYFTIKSLKRILSLYNLYIENIGNSPISGGSLIVYARKKKVNESPIVQSLSFTEEQINLNSLKSWEGFAERVISHREKLLKILNSNLDKVIVGYGASARSSTLLNFCKIDSKLIPIIADQNPLKQGLYTAGTHILIDSLENVMRKKPKFIIILAWNFTNEIIKALKKGYKFKGELLIPLPNDPKIMSLR